jgi:hypothetical protein
VPVKRDQEKGGDAVLRQVDRQGYILILQDGRMLRLVPSDATLAVTRIPSTMFEVCQHRESVAFPLAVFNTVNDAEYTPRGMAGDPVPGRH